MKKIIFITQWLPYPDDSGGKIQTLAVVRALSKKYRITLVCFLENDPKKGNLDYLKKYCEVVKCFVWPRVKARYISMKDEVVKNTFSIVPFTVYRYYCPEAKKFIDDEFKRNNFDLVWVDHTNMAQYLPSTKKCLWILDEHNIEAAAKTTVARFEPRLLFKIGFAWEAIRLYFYEKRIIKKFDVCLAISEIDRKKMIELGSDPKKTWLMPVAIKLNNIFLFKKTKKPAVLFIGSLSWWPNRDGAKWFVDNVWLLVREKVPGAELWLVGENPVKFTKNWNCGDAGVKFFDHVPSIEPFFRKASVMVAPIRMGGGIRIKILTALAMGVPVVATTKAAEGIELKNGKEFLLANKAKEMAKKIVDLIENEKLSKDISKAGEKFVKLNYSENGLVAVIDKIENV